MDNTTTTQSTMFFSTKLPSSCTGTAGSPSSLDVFVKPEGFGGKSTGEGIHGISNNRHLLRPRFIGSWRSIARAQDLMLTELLQARKTIRPTTLDHSLRFSAGLILFTGGFHGKRVMDLKPLSGGVRVTGPMKVNGVPLRRVNARYVIATSAGVDLAGVDM
jgi:hypothetical protein